MLGRRLPRGPGDSLPRRVPEDVAGPSEDVEVAVVGGGISGLATAHRLRDHHPVVFDKLMPAGRFDASYVVMAGSKHIARHILRGLDAMGPEKADAMNADGYAGHLRRPFDEQVYFANQDNWALPAIENSLLDARWVAEEIRGRL